MEFRKQIPIFKQIAEHVLELIITDQWSSGDRIPSVRDLAAESDVNANTIARTYSLLSDQKIIFTERGVGYFIHKDAKKKALIFLKKQFLKEELPYLLKKASLLDIPFSELKKYHDEK